MRFSVLRSWILDKIRHPVNLWHWSSTWGWFPVLLVGGLAFIAVNEFAIGLSLMALSMLSLASKLWHTQSARYLKILGTLGVLILMMAFVMVTIAFMEERPWSNLPIFWGRFVTLKHLSTKTKPPVFPPDFSRFPSTRVEEQKQRTPVKDSLVINALAGYGNYVEGSMIGSINPIKWENYYSEVQVIFVNTSPEDYDAFDVSVDPDQVIFAVSQMTVVPGVSIFSPNGGPGTQLPPPGQTKPLPPNSVLLLPNDIDTSPRRVRCERFPSKVPIRVIFAVANVKFPPGTKHGHVLMFGFGTPDLNPKALPQWVKIEGSYKLQGQKFQVSKTVEFTQAALP